MTTPKDAVDRVIFPIKNYEDLCKRLQESFSYEFVRAAFNFTLPALVHYVELELGGDSRGRYTEYASALIKTIHALEGVGITDILDLMMHTNERGKLAAFAKQSHIPVSEIADLMKYLIFWVVPIKKYLSGLTGDEPSLKKTVDMLGRHGVRTNLDLLQHGITAADRKALADVSGLPLATITALVHRADLSRMPWASKATISNIVGAGYGSLAQLAKADLPTLCADFYDYGKSIHKNLKHGNEIESSHRIAQIVPTVLQEG